MGITDITTASGVLSSRGILRALILLSLFIFAPILASAATYYIAPSGSNSNPGTQAQPFATLQKAHDVAVADDTVYMRGGTYLFPAQTVLTRDGASGKHIKVFNYPGEVPVIDGINQPGGVSARAVILMDGASWWHIKGLELKNGPTNGIIARANSSNNIFERLHIHHIGRLSNGGGVALGIGAVGINNLVINNDVHDNDDELGSGGSANGISVSDAGSGNVIRGNRAWRNADDGIDMWNSAPALIENNWVWLSGYDQDGVTLRGDGQGFKLGGSGPNDGGHTLKNNVSWKNREHGFHENGGDLPMKIYNNTAWSNGHNSFFFDNPATTFRNNISHDTVGRTAGSTSFNSWTQSVTVNDSDFESLNDACARGPRQGNGSLPNCSFLRLATGSDLIDKGTNVGIPYTGSAPDLGAFEYGGTSAGTNPPTVSITAPTNGATVVSGTAVAVSATASDNVGVAGVQFKLNGANLGAEDITSPYSVTWNSTTGSHTLAAVARDAAGNIGTSAGVTVTANNASGSTSTIGETSILSVTDSNNGNKLVAQPATLSQTATIRSLAFYVVTASGNLRLGIYDATGPGGRPGAKKAETASITPTTGWNTANVTPVSLPPGTYWLAYLASSNSLKFKGENTGGNSRLYSFPFKPMPATFSTAAGPSAWRWSLYATLTFGTSGATISGTAVTVSATASDNVGVAGVQFKLDGANLGAEDTTAPYSSTTATNSSVFSRPVAAYNFEEASGSKVIDASGQGNHGTRSGNSRIPQGRFGKALSFDDLNDWVTVNDAASLDLTTGMTVEAWVYPTESMTGWRTLLTKESPPDRASYYLHANSDTDQPATGVFIGDYQDVRGGPWLLPDTWVHLAGTYDGTTQRLYVNGTEVANRAQSRPIEVSGGVLRIGGNSILGEIFKGRIDEIRVYNRALSASEITTDMHTSVATSSPPVFLVGDKNLAPVTDSISQGEAQAFQTQAAVTGWVTGLSVYVDTGSTGTTLVAGLYTDENDHPSTLLAQGTLGSPGSGGWKMVSLPPVSITAGSKYWVAILIPSGMLTFRDSGTWVGGLSETSSQSTLSELPGTWTTGTYEFEGPLSAYGAGYQ